MGKPPIAVAVTNDDLMKGPGGHPSKPAISRHMFTSRTCVRLRDTVAGCGADHSLASGCGMNEAATIRRLTKARSRLLSILQSPAWWGPEYDATATILALV